MKRNEGGFSLIEMMVVLLLTAILLAIAAPQMLGNTIISNDEHAQALAVQAANVLTSVFAQSQSYQCNTPTGNMELSQLENVVSASQLPWNKSEGDLCNAGQNLAGAGTDYNISVYSWSGTGDTVNGVNYDSATTVAVTANAKSNKADCWFITEHAAGGPAVYGYIDSTCATFETCWEETPQASPIFYAHKIGCVYEDSKTALQNGSFPPDPQA